MVKLNLADYVGLPWTEFEAKINEALEKPGLYPLGSVVEDVPYPTPPVPPTNPDSHIVTDIAPAPKLGSERKVEVDPTSIGVVIEPPPILPTPVESVPMASLSGAPAPVAPAPVAPAPGVGLPQVRGVWCLLGVVASSVTGAVVALARVPASGTAGAGTVSAGGVALAIGVALAVGMVVAGIGQVRGLRGSET